jgi:hypothetical protein
MLRRMLRILSAIVAAVLASPAALFDAHVNRYNDPADGGQLPGFYIGKKLRKRRDVRPKRAVPRMIDRVEIAPTIRVISAQGRLITSNRSIH